MPASRPIEPEFTPHEERHLWRMLLHSELDRAPSQQSESFCSNPLDPAGIASLLEDRLPMADRAAIEAHLAQCNACRAAARDASALHHHLKESPPPVVPATLIERVRELMHENDRHPLIQVKRNPLPFALARWGLATAASVAICAIGWQAGSGFGSTDPAANDRALESEMTFGMLDESEIELDGDNAGLIALIISEDAL